VLKRVIQAAARPGQTLQKKVLMISADGTRPGALAVARTPNLDAVRTNDRFSDRAINHVMVR
jgi:hypothetical protein